jgi:hypothetical protein
MFTQAKFAARGKHPNLTTLTLLRLYWPLLLYHSFWVLCEVGIRWDELVGSDKYLILDLW